jgi:hypothetical protein
MLKFPSDLALVARYINPPRSMIDIDHTCARRCAYPATSKRDGLPFRRLLSAEKQPEEIRWQQPCTRRQPSSIRTHLKHIWQPPIVTPRAMPRRAPRMPRWPSSTRSPPQSGPIRPARRASSTNNTPKGPVHRWASLRSAAPRASRQASQALDIEHRDHPIGYLDQPGFLQCVQGPIDTLPRCADEMTKLFVGDFDAALAATWLAAEPCRSSFIAQGGPQMGEVITPASPFAWCREATRPRGGVSPPTPKWSARGNLDRRSCLWQRRQFPEKLRSQSRQ